MSDHAPAWPADCHSGVDTAIALFKQLLPGWWYSLGECQVSCDASCAPTPESGDLDLIPRDARFDSGFHVDIPQPSTLAQALAFVMDQALVAKAAAMDARIDVVATCPRGSTAGTATGTYSAADLVRDVALRTGVVLSDWKEVVGHSHAVDDAHDGTERRTVLSLPGGEAARLFSSEEVLQAYGLETLRRHA